MINIVYGHKRTHVEGFNELNMHDSINDDLNVEKIIVLLIIIYIFK